MSNRDTDASLIDIPPAGIWRVPSRSIANDVPSVQRARRLRTRTKNPGRDLEPVVERDALVEQKRRGGQVAFCGVDAPALQLPADERRACLFHDVSLTDRRRTFSKL